MCEGNQENLKTIFFNGEMLPKWAQLLDLAARIGPVPVDVRTWFSRLSNFNGVEDSRSVLSYCQILRRCLQENRSTIFAALQTTPGHPNPSQILAAWDYALETMVQQASLSKTCSWTLEGIDDRGGDEHEGGDITIRRV